MVGVNGVREAFCIPITVVNNESEEAVNKDRSDKRL